MHIYGLVAVHFAHHYNARGLPPRCRNVDVVYIYIYNNQDGRTRRDETRRDETSELLAKNYTLLKKTTRPFWPCPVSPLGLPEQSGHARATSWG